jgi:anti-anti-sigma regulatory factor
MDNVLQHANTTHGYVMGQIHPTSQHIALCIYDFGQGIYNSLRNTQYAPKDAVDAIMLAVKEGVTRDKLVGQGNGMWGLNNIVRSNSGILGITSGSGFFGINRDEIRKSTNVPFLSPEHNCTTVDFQIDFDKGISISEALGGHEPVDVRIEHLEDDRGNVVYRLADKPSGTGTRQSGAALRNEVVNITRQTDSVVLLDFTGVSMVSSSFADEFIGKLAVEFGFIGFTQRFRLIGMNPTVQSIANRSVSQRLGLGNGG